jgi:excisionase family DNA binding protein
VAYPTYIREKARQMRRDKKLTIDELSERLAISRTTIYYWVRDMPIPRSRSGGGFSDAARRKGNRMMQQKYRDLREAAYQEGLMFYQHLVQDPSFRDFLCLFIAEGHKRSRHEVSIANSDPSVIHAAIRWMKVLSARKLTYSVQYHADQSLAEIRRFWAEQLGVEREEIKLQRKSNSGRLGSRTWRSEHGVLTVRTSDSYFREELQAWIDCLRGTWLDSTSIGA